MFVVLLFLVLFFHEGREAALRGYNIVLAEAFVIPEREVWWLENVETGERKFVLRKEKIRLIGEEEETESSADEKASEKEDEGEESASSSTKTADKPRQ